MAAKFDISKFRFSELFNNNDGKSSGSAFIGITGSMFCMVLLSGITIAIYTLKKDAFPNSVVIINALQSIALGVFTLASLYAALLGLRKWRSTTRDFSTSIEDDKVDNQK